MNVFSCDINENVMDLQSLQNNELMALNLNYLEMGEAEDGIELQITNLDRSIPPNQLRDILLNLFRIEVVPVRDLNISFLSDGKPQAIVKLDDQQAAQLAINRLHRKKLGHKRIYLSHRTKSSLCSQKSKVVSVLMNVPSGRIHLIKFREMYEKRFNSSVKITDLYRMKDIITIFDDLSGRVLQLNPNISDIENLPDLESLFCEKHSSSKELGDEECGRKPLLLLDMSLQELSSRIKHVIRDHGGRVPMASLTDCYKHYYGDPEETGPNAVPFLYLITFVKGVQIISDESGLKSMVDTTLDVLPSGDSKETHSLHLANQFSLFSRELVDLLKTWPGGRMPFNKFIPNFHHYFGRQCRVADYGYTKLRDLFEAMPHVVNVLGEGSKAIITLSNRAQIRRFTSDFLKVLRFEPEKQVLLSDFPAAFEAQNGRPFKISDYGVCRVEDMLDLLPENTVAITHVKEKKLYGISKLGSVETNILISLPRPSVQTVDRTQQFAKEVADLLKHAPDCTLNFNKFIPAFHHHFGVQCRVIDYGYDKLIDLFEAIPKIVDMSEDADGEKQIQLTHVERLKVLGEQILKLVEKKGETGLLLSDVLTEFKIEFGFQLSLEMLKIQTAKQLIELVPNWVRVVFKDSQDYVQITNKVCFERLGSKVLQILSSEKLEGAWMSLPDFKQDFHIVFGNDIELSDLSDKIVDMVEIQEDKIRLTPKAVAVKNIENILKEGRLTLPQLDYDYQARFRSKLNPGVFGHTDLLSFLSSLSSLSIRGQGLKLTVGLQEYRDSPTISKLCRTRFQENQAYKRFAMKCPSPETRTLPPLPPSIWILGCGDGVTPPPPFVSGSINGRPTFTPFTAGCIPPPPVPPPPPPFFYQKSHTQSSLLRNGLPTLPPPLLHPCTPPPPPPQWNQRGNQTPLRMASYWSSSQQMTDFSKEPTFKPNGMSSESIFTCKPMSWNGQIGALGRNLHSDPTILTMSHLKQVSPLSRAPPGGTTHTQQGGSSRIKDQLQMNGGFTNSSYTQQTSYVPERNETYQQQNNQSLFSHSFSVPIPPRTSAQQTFTFQGVGLAMSPTLAGSPLSPGLSTGLYHIPPINTNSPDSGLGDYSILKQFGDAPVFH